MDEVVSTIVCGLIVSVVVTVVSARQPVVDVREESDSTAEDEQEFGGEEEVERFDGVEK